MRREYFHHAGDIVAAAAEVSGGDAETEALLHREYVWPFSDVGLATSFPIFGN